MIIPDIPFLGVVRAGFPSPATDYMEEDIDLRKYLQPNPTSIYLARVKGDSMINSHIPDESLVVIDKSLPPQNNSIIIASLDGENIIKHFVKTHSGVFLASNNPAYKPIRITAENDFTVWGVVTHVIIKLQK
ncbi:MAG: translesion error-prone DNA polymerase V autoproteolytic subunit [Chitinophagaceae bacterium]